MWKRVVKLPSSSSSSSSISSKFTTSIPQQLTSSFYDETIRKVKSRKEFSAREIRPITLRLLLGFGRPPLTEATILESARYAQSELPVRLARRIQAFQRLPFIVGTNPFVRDAHATYYQSFEALRDIPLVSSLRENETLTNKLRELTEKHKEIIPKLARGFLECRQYISLKDTTRFLDELIHSRIGIRLIAEHHIALHQPSQDYIGIVHTRLRPAKLFNDVALYVQRICEMNYGDSPGFLVNGLLDTEFQYVPVHLEYMAIELLKNSFRATVEFHRSKNQELPPIEITVTQGQEEVGIRIRDRGGGIRPEDVDRVFEYSYTTVKEEEEEQGEEFGWMMRQSQMGMQSSSGGPMAGLGYGLPMAQLYAQYFGGSLDLMSLPGHGCDVFLTLKSIGSIVDIQI